MIIRIHHDVVDEITARGENLVDWVYQVYGKTGPLGWRVLLNGDLVVEPLHDAIANMKPTAEETDHA